MNGFGASAPIDDLYTHFGITERSYSGGTPAAWRLDNQSQIFKLKSNNRSNTGDFTIGN